jgi:hypothetical protein
MHGVEAYREFLAVRREMLVGAVNGFLARSKGAA